MFRTLHSTLAKKSIILLGESAHGVREYNQIRLSLIQKLNHEFDFKVIMVESAVGPIIRTENIDALSLVKSNFHKVYHTEEVVELIQYALDEKMLLAGFEMNPAQLDIYKDLNKNEGYYRARSYRDKVMFENFAELVNGPLSGKKVIIWAHNIHIMKKTTNGAFREKVLGEFISEAYGEEVLSIGQYAGSGDFEHMPGQKVNFSILPSGSLEELIRETRRGITLVDDLSESCFNHIMPTLNCGLEVDNLNPAEHFDALILHEKATAPIRV